MQELHVHAKTVSEEVAHRHHEQRAAKCVTVIDNLLAKAVPEAVKNAAERGDTKAVVYVGHVDPQTLKEILASPQYDASNSLLGKAVHPFHLSRLRGNMGEVTQYLLLEW